MEESKHTLSITDKDGQIHKLYISYEDWKAYEDWKKTRSEHQSKFKHQFIRWAEPNGTTFTMMKIPF